MKEKSCAAAMIGVRPISPSATSIASFSPVDFCAARIRSGYFFWSRNCSGSTIGSGTLTSEKMPPSNSAVKRARGEIAMWWSQFEQTFRFSASSRWNSMVPHSGHLVHRFSGISRRENNELIFGLT